MGAKHILYADPILALTEVIFKIPRREKVADRFQIFKFISLSAHRLTKNEKGVKKVEKADSQALSE